MVIQAIVFLLVREIRRVVTRRERTMSVRILTGVGDRDAKRRFIESHKPFRSRVSRLAELDRESV